MQDNNIIQDSNEFVQLPSLKEEINMLGKAFKSFLDTLIRENAVFKNDGYDLWVYQINDSDKKIFLSYLIDIEDYRYSISNSIRQHQAFAEYQNVMQILLDERMNELYHEDMKEMGMLLCSHKDNGESFYIRGN